MKAKNKKYLNPHFWLLFACYWLLLCPQIYAEGAYIYDPGGRRDPFVPLIGGVEEGPKAAESLADVTSIEEIELQGLASDASGQKIAIMNSEMIKEGQTAGLLTVKRILNNKIVLLIDGEEYVLRIYDVREMQAGE